MRRWSERMTHGAWVTVAVCLLVGFALPAASQNPDLQAPQILDLTFASSVDGETDAERTLRSLARVDDAFYTMTYFGDYREFVDDLNDQIIEHGIFHVIQGGGDRCSIFAATGDNESLIFGRNLDNYTKRAILVGRFSPPDGYTSIAVMNLIDMGFEPEDDLLSLPLAGREKLLNSVLFVTDGMNECGVAIAHATIDPQRVTRDESKKLVNLQYVEREILDFAANLEEAIEIIESRDVVDMDNETLTHHFLVADASGASAVAEYRGGRWRILRSEQPWQIATNNVLHMSSDAKLRYLCWRYRVADDRLEESEGAVTWQEGMDILSSMSEERTQWSSIYDLSHRTLYLTLWRDYAMVYRTAPTGP